MSKTTDMFAPEVRERAVRMVFDYERERWLGKSAQAGKWSFCLKAASMATEQEIR